MSELVSIVMPVKNAEKHLGATVGSIQKQTHQNWELIAVNDHSSDQSGDIIGKLSDTDARIKLIQNKGNGILDALNTATSIANGDFITRMDADDLMTLVRLESQIQLLKISPAKTIATGLVKYFREDQTLGAGYLQYEKWLNNLCKQGTHFHHIYQECVIPSPSWLMRMNEFKDVGGFLGLDYPEDYDFVFRLYHSGFNVVSAPHPVLYWRDHASRASRTLEVYSDQTFFPLKVRRFMQIDRKPEKELFLYGAGPKGKKLARELIARQIDFRWISGNTKKTGLNIYRKTIEHEELGFQYLNAQIVVAISSPRMKKEVVEKLRNMPEVYYFC